MTYASDSTWPTTLVSGGLYKPRAARKIDKARAKYIEERQPEHYLARKSIFETETNRVRTETVASIRSVEDELKSIDTSLPRATSEKALRALQARRDALQAMIDSYLLAMSTAIDTLMLKYRDVVEYEAGLASFG